MKKHINASGANAILPEKDAKKSDFMKRPGKKKQQREAKTEAKTA